MTEGEGVALGYVGHATVLVEVDGVRVLTDPFLRDRLGPLERHGPTPDAAEIGPVDVVLVSHGHPDHFDRRSLEAIEAEMHRVIRFNASAKSAVSAALHDLAAKRLGVPLHRMLGLDPARAPQSSFTIPLAADDEALQRALDDAAPYPVLKVKLGGLRDAHTIASVRAAAPDKILRVDANAAWDAKHALRMIDLLLDYDVEFVEQPVAAHDIEGLRFVRDRSPLPIIADESCLLATDVPRLAGAVDGINLKLAKCGGIRQAMRLIATARAHDMSVMAGCMVESSLGITAVAHLAPLLDYADLDGAALLAVDPFVGASIEGGVVTLPTAPGLGVSQRHHASVDHGR